MARRAPALKRAPESGPMERCAHCGRLGLVGRDVVPLASRVWVHHGCWAEFYAVRTGKKTVSEDVF